MTIPKFESNHQPSDSLKPFELRDEMFHARKASIPLLAMLREKYPDTFDRDDTDVGEFKIDLRTMPDIIGDLLTKESAERFIPLMHDIDDPISTDTLMGIIRYIIAGVSEDLGVDDDPKAETSSPSPSPTGPNGITNSDETSPSTPTEPKPEHSSTS